MREPNRLICPYTIQRIEHGIQSPAVLFFIDFLFIGTLY